jgi:hypothetical protein
MSARTMPMKSLQVNVKDRMAEVAANLDDMQAGLEACCRAADALYNETGKLYGLIKPVGNTPSFSAVLRHAAKLQVWTRDQRGTLQDLRESLRRLHEELERSNVHTGG